MTDVAMMRDAGLRVAYRGPGARYRQAQEPPASSQQAPVNVTAAVPAQARGRCSR